MRQFKLFLMLACFCRMACGQQQAYLLVSYWRSTLRELTRVTQSGLLYYDAVLTVEYLYLRGYFLVYLHKRSVQGMRLTTSMPAQHSVSLDESMGLQSYDSRPCLLLNIIMARSVEWLTITANWQFLVNDLSKAIQNTTQLISFSFKKLFILFSGY